jgi:hypothetical protein
MSQDRRPGHGGVTRLLRTRRAGACGTLQGRPDWSGRPSRLDASRAREDLASLTILFNAWVAPPLVETVRWGVLMTSFLPESIERIRTY